jgi:tape measure domain-containing protein
MAAQITDELRVLVEAEVEKAIRDMEKFDKAVDASAKDAASLGKALSAIEKQMLIVSGAMIAAGGAGIKFAAENERLKKSLENMLGSANEAEKVFQQWRDLGTSPGLSIEEVFALGKSLVSLGNDAGYATATIKAMGDIAAGSGASFGTISGIYEKVRAQGQLTLRDLNQMQQQGIPIVAELAQSFETSETHIKELASRGKIGFPELEKAFAAMASSSGKFAGAMDKLSGTTLEKLSTATDDARQALAAFGELMLPLANDVLDFASSAFRALGDMDEGTKRFILGMGGMVAASGPAIAALVGLNKAFTALGKNPYIAGISLAIAGTAALAGYINKQAHAYEDLNANLQRTREKSNALLSAYADGNRAKILDAETTQRLITLYPGLAGEITAYTASVDDAAAAVKRLTEQEAMNAANKQIEKLSKQEESARKAAEAYEAFRTEALKLIEQDESMGWMDKALERREAIEVYKNAMDNAVKKANETAAQINAALATIGKTLGGNYEIIDIPVSLVPAGGAPEPPPITTDQKKRWQEWYSEVTKVDLKAFDGAEGSGGVAAKQFLSGFERSLSASKTVSEALGSALDITGMLRSQQGEIQRALTELFSIDRGTIDDPFKLMDESVKPLIKDYDDLSKKIREIEYPKMAEELRKKIKDLGKSESELALETMKAAGYEKEQADAVKALMDEYSRKEILNEYQQRVTALGLSQEALARQTLEAKGATEEELKAFDAMVEKLKDPALGEDSPAGRTFQELFTGWVKGALDDLDLFSEKANGVLADLAYNFANISMDAALTGLNEIGFALAQNADAGTAMKDALAAMSLQILDALPGMFMQAGLQLIATPGMWPLGLGLLAAAGATSLIGGYVKGSVEQEKADAKEAAPNARGNAFEEAGMAAYAHGGAFTNQIVNAPTYFRYGGALGVMGEAGAEAIMPLRRMPNGDLGVAAGDTGGGAAVVVNIINNSGEAAKADEKTDARGNKQIDVIIGKLIDGHIASGKADKAMTARYGVKAKGV